MPTQPSLADGRREGDGVVRVDDALAEAEDRAGHDEPGAPEQQAGGPGAVGPGGPAPPDDAGHQRQQGGRQHV